MKHMNDSTLCYRLSSLHPTSLLVYTSRSQLVPEGLKFFVYVYQTALTTLRVLNLKLSVVNPCGRSNRRREQSSTSCARLVQYNVYRLYHACSIYSL